VSGSVISWAICKSAPRSRQITTPAPHRSVFYRPDALPATQPTASKHWRQKWNTAILTLNRMSVHMALPWVIIGSSSFLPSQQSSSIHLHKHEHTTLSALSECVTAPRLPLLRRILKLRTFSVPQTHPAIFLCSNCSCFISDPLAIILCCFRCVFNLSDLYFYVCITIVNITRWLLYVLYCKHTSRPSSVLCLCVRYSREWGKGSPYSIAERRVPALIPVFSSHAKHSATEPPIVNITS